MNFYIKLLLLFWSKSNSENMKTITYLFALLTISLFLSHCGTDNPVNNGGNGNSQVVYTLDSFSIHTYSPGLFDTNLTQYRSFSLDTFSVSFQVFTNNDSTNYDYVSYNIVDSGNVISTQTIHGFHSGDSYYFTGHLSNNAINKVVNLNIGLRNNYIGIHKYTTIKYFKIINQ